MAEELGVPEQSMFGGPNSAQLHHGPLATFADASAGSNVHDTTRTLSADWRSFPPRMMDQALRGPFSLSWALRR